MFSLHRPRQLSRHVIGAAFVWLAASGCAKTDQPPEPAAPSGVSPSAASSGAGAGEGQLALPGAGATEAPEGVVPVPGDSARNGPSNTPPSGPLSLDALALPPGFSIQIYSAEVPNARSLALGPKGVVFVSNRTEDKVYALVDANADHQVDRVQVVASGLDTPNGIAYKDGSLFIAEVGRLLRIDGIDTKLDHPPEPKLVTDKLPKEKHHGWRYLRFGPDGLLYMPVGAPCNVCEREDPIFATITRMKPDGTGLEVFAKGVRNSVGFDWHPQTKALWFTENGRDELGDDIPGDEIGRADKAGLHFGFPYCHAGKFLDPAFGNGKSCASYEPPALALGAHVAALGMRFNTGKMFPEKYRNALFFAQHGSWNRSHKSGYNVMVAQLDGDRIVSAEPFVKGWLNEQSDEVSGRPTDVEWLDDGSLLISDDYRGAVYRVTYRG